MSRHLELGRRGEDAAAGFLEAAGMKILHRNWKTAAGEIDIVAQDGAFLVIVEVKTRQSALFGNPEESVNYRKQRQLVQLTDAYIRQYNVNLETRFDVLSVLLSGPSCQITHHVNAFSPFD